MGKTGLGECRRLWAVTWSHKVHTFLDTGHLHSARVADARSSGGGWVSHRPRLSACTYLNVLAFGKFFSPHKTMFNYFQTTYWQSRARKTRVGRRLNLRYSNEFSTFPRINRHSFSNGTEYFVLLTSNKIRNVCITLTLRSVLATVLAMEKQYYIPHVSVCVCSLR